MDILVSRTLYMSCQAGPGIEPGPSVLKASALPIELTCQTYMYGMSQQSTSPSKGLLPKIPHHCEVGPTQYLANTSCFIDTYFWLLLVVQRHLVGS